MRTLFKLFVRFFGLGRKMDFSSKSFMARALDQEFAVQDMEEIVDDAIDSWHQAPPGTPLHTYLGLTWEEYALWVEHKRTVWQLVRARSIASD